MVSKFVVIFSQTPPDFMDFLISPSHPLQLFFWITMPAVPQHYEKF